MNAQPASSDHSATLDPENPWLGLFSYTEATRAYFHGRDEETAELARRVQHKLLTVLFGQSGLGKTSLLRAGLVPRLRREGYCPVYVRIDYAPDSPTPARQIRQAIFRSTHEAGHWTRPGSSADGESLWELLHHREDFLRDTEGHPLTPLLIFDQFEEIFTLGQADDTGKQRAQQFLEDLADLVENRAPRSLEARMEEDDEAATDFDFGRADYRVLITLREDYLAFLESVKDTMPSITQNRMRLARMSGEQALSAVLKPGGKLVTGEVAEAIVRFVAGGAELKNAEIEPSLLSLVCRELNTIRQHQQRKEISTDLLAGSRETILSEFYERTLADQPEGARRVIEDELLTESGFRESVAEERVAKALADAGATPDALPALVNRRLLRIEERLDVRRVELTHDVLCKVVQASRNMRREREAREQAERELAAQREREAATHRALRRARLIATVCSVLLLLALASAAFGFWSLHRARTAEAQAQSSRAHAEDLVSFLIEDFYNDLEPTGRLETLGKLARRTVDYYNTLPTGQVTKQTRINRAMALAREAAAQQSSGNVDAATVNFEAARGVFNELRDAGDRSEAVVYGLALTLFSEGTAAISAMGGHGTVDQLQQAADMLRPLAYGPHPSRRVRQLYADSLNYLCVVHNSEERAVQLCEEGRKILAGLGALDLSDLKAASSYADTSDSQARALALHGRLAEAEKLGKQTYEMTEKILAKRPGDLHALTNRWYASEFLGTLATRQYDYAGAADYMQRTVQAAIDLVRFNPADVNSWALWAMSLSKLADRQWQRGDVAKALATAQSIPAMERDPRRPPNLGVALSTYLYWAAAMQADAGNRVGSAALMKTIERSYGELAASYAADDPRREIISMFIPLARADLQRFGGSQQTAYAAATTGLQRLESMEGTVKDAVARSWYGVAMRSALTVGADTALRIGKYAEAEALARRLLALPPGDTTENDPRGVEFTARALLADAVAAQGRREEAHEAMRAVQAYYADQQKAGADGTAFRRRYAYAMYVSAISQADDANGRRQRLADLDKASTLIAGISDEARQLVTTRHVATLIAGARAGRDR